MDTTAAISSKPGKREIRATILLAAVAFHAPLLLVLSSRQRRGANPVGRFLLWSVSAAYFPLMTSVLSYLTTYIPSAGAQATGVLVLVILVQFLRAKADMAAMAVAAVASPASGDDDVNSLKIRPSTESFINTFWVAGLVIYNIISTALKDLKSRDSNADDLENAWLMIEVMVLISPLWALGACRTVLRFAAFQRATDSFALGRNVQLIDGYMLQLREEGGWFVDGGEMAAAGQQPQHRLPDEVQVPPLIVTGESKKDVEESPLGYHVKPSSLKQQQGAEAWRKKSSRLVTLDRVWKSDSDDDNRRPLQPEDKDLCLSFALFKCLRRRFAGYRLAAEAGSTWAFRFVCDGLLLDRSRNKDDYERVFRVIATELSFASDFFHSPLPVASLGTTAAALHFVFSLIILPSLLLLAFVLLVIYVEIVGSSSKHYCYPLELLALILTLTNAGLEISEMVASVRSNWTKISIIGHIVRSKHHCTRRFLAWLLRRCKTPKFWHDKIQQTQMLKTDLFVVQQRPCAWSRRRLRASSRLSRQLLSLGWGRNHHDKIKVPLVVKKAILESLRSSGGQLSDGTAAIKRHAFATGNDITWACRDDGVVTITDAILVWHIATTLFDMKCRSSSPASSPSPATPPVVANDSSKAVVACCLSRYCMHLVAEAPELLPDKPAWITRRYEAVKKRIEEAPKCSGDESSVYQHLVDTFSGGGGNSHDVLINGVRLGKQLVEEAEIRRRQRSQGGGRGAEAGAQAEDEVWELLSDFWSEMVLYLAPSDNVKVHIEALQRGGELITLLWALLLHAGITSRPVEYNFIACVRLSTGDPDAIAHH
ncbi:uncharacterized protein LOC8070211 [Sorghum bicolor]|uniref:DUF4220 domain-containing protein n=1 Tax=Sorghum bicolor TaxID=4558 RepID=C5Y7K0_SORBI|nr:uncharacterized protein LOC8070211 [Sorghum bicolor]EES08955.1 hypothetical protein SORBI_3005G209900 [Sorghum bicolor]|eukprot:XP_002449967.1 uncharacterized protein LOC8070211 [Sorghum bicolor]